MSSPLYPAQWLLFLALYRACYETANAGPPATPPGFVPSAENSQPVAMTPREREWADRATGRYAQAQEKKWRSWNDAMFERSG